MRQAIEAAIFEGNLKPGDKLDEKVFCARFKTSRTPVREAMLQLAVQGLIEVKPRSGLFVATASHKQLLSMLEMIAELEGVAASMAARRLSPQDRQSLLNVQAEGVRLAEADDVAAYTQANAAFHELLYKAAGNELLGEMTRNLRRRLFLYRRNVLEAPGRLKGSSEEHAEVVRMVIAGDEAGAKQAMVSHISRGNRAFIDLVMSLP